MSRLSQLLYVQPVEKEEEASTTEEKKNPEEEEDKDGKSEEEKIECVRLARKLEFDINEEIAGKLRLAEVHHGDRIGQV